MRIHLSCCIAHSKKQQVSVFVIQTNKTLMSHILLPWLYHSILVADNRENRDGNLPGWGRHGVCIWSGGRAQRPDGGADHRLALDRAGRTRRHPVGGEPQHSARWFQGGGHLLLSHCYYLVDCSVTTLGIGGVGGVWRGVCMFLCACWGMGMEWFSSGF